MKDLLKGVKHLLELESLMGVDFIPRSLVGLNPSLREDFDSFKERVLQCKRCALHRERKQVVFGCGKLTSPIVFVGEAPGYEEDLQGEPFVGRAGRLLTESLEKLGILRQDVYIANIIKCRPPANRQPRLDEITICFPYLKKQIGFINPKLVCALGGVAAQTLLSTDLPMTKLRGKLLDHQGMKIFCMFHPAYILRNPREAPIFERDLKEACKLAGLI